MKGQIAGLPATAEGPPRMAANLRLTERNQGLLAEWGPAPDSSSSTPVTSYDVRYRLYGTADRWKEINRSAADVTLEQVIRNLTNRKAYEVQVAATNRYGRGPWATNSAVPQANQFPPAPAEAPGANPDTQFKDLGAWWTHSYGSTRIHDDVPRAPNGMYNSCLDTYSFKIIWKPRPTQADEYEAHFITRYGAGEVTHEFVTQFVHSSQAPRGQWEYTLLGTVTMHKYSSLYIRVRARYGDTWNTWSRPVLMNCSDE